MNIKDFAHNIKHRSEKFADVISACQYLINKPYAKETNDYINNRMSSSSIKKFGIGYFPSNENINDLISLVGENVLLELGLIYRFDFNNRSHVDKLNMGFFHYHNMIMPFKDEYGNIIALAGRTLLEKDQQVELNIPKYKNTQYAKAMHLYGLYEAQNSIQKKQFVIIVEGQIDCISCHANGIFNVVALTCSELTWHQLYLLKKYTNKIYLLLDNDAAGQKAVNKSIRKYSKVVDIERLSLPDQFNDVDEYLTNTAQVDLFTNLGA